MNLPDIRFDSGTIEQYFSRMNDITSLEVLPMLKAHQVWHPGWVKIMFLPASYFFRRYWFSGEYKAGVHGLIKVACESITVLVFAAKLWEYQWRKNEHADMLPPLTSPELQKMKQW